MYWCPSSVIFNDLGVGIKLLHLIIVCFVHLPEERVETLIEVHHIPCPFKMCFHVID